MIDGGRGAQEGSRRTTTRSSACPRTPAIPRSVRRTASSRSSTTPTRGGDPAAEDRFKEISAAYDVLGDEEKRASYDRVREMGPSGFGPGTGGAGGAGWPGAAGWPGGVRYEQVNVDDLGDLFGGLFEGRAVAGRRGGPRRGADLETQVRIPFEESMSGTTVQVRIDGGAACSRCGGSGAEPGTTPTTCPTCGGRRDRREPGVLLDVAPVPHVRGVRPDRRDAVHARWVRRGAPDPPPERRSPPA